MSDRTAFPGNHIDADSSHHQGRWRFEHGDSIDAVQATPGSYREPGESLPLEQIGIPEAAFAWDRGVRIGGRDAASRAQLLLPVLIIGALSAALALGLIGAFQFLVFAPASTAIEHKPDCSDHALDSKEANCIASKSDREAIPSARNVQKVAAPTAMTGSEPSHSTTQKATASTHTVTLATQQNATSPRPRAVAIQYERSLPRQAPVPETKPGTIEGWTVREVVGGTAVLEGPNGQWRATSGDTVPGLGKVDSIVRWGSRWIVATSKGLVSTP
jgi:hypothetical protein